MKRSPFASFCSLWVVLAAAGCGGRDPLLEPVPVDGGPDAAGTTPTPPTPPVGRDAGSAGGTARDAANQPTPIDSCQATVPRCITDLQTPECTPSGTCIQQFNPGAVSPNVCYANGVKILPTPSSTARMFTLRFLRADGTTCYSIRSTGSSQGSVSRFVYLNARDVEVASATIERNGLLAVTCTNQPNPVIVQLACQPGVSGQARCAAGTCR